VGVEQALEDEGAMIYEGMSISFDRDGTYVVRFIVDCPAMPVTLRLQLVARDGDRVGTITLPPITLAPRNGSDNEPEADTFRVEHSGYSPFFAERRTGPLCSGVQFERRGTARFGSGVPVSVIGYR
jgi:hypothetical protein